MTVTPDLPAIPEVVYGRAFDSPVDDFIASWSRLMGGVHRGPDGVTEAIAGRTPVVFADDKPSREEMAAATVGVVRAVAAVAATGSVVIDARQARGVSLLPTVCVFIVRAADIVATPGDVLRHKGKWWPDGPPSQIVFVTGPSRSGDIEMQLLTGVHGPGEVHVAIV